MRKNTEATIMNSHSLIASLSLSLAITACGGGGGGGGSSNGNTTDSASANITPTPVEQPVAPTEPQSPADTTAALRVPEGFDLRQDYTLTISSFLGDSQGSQYLTVCRDYKEAAEGFDVNLQSCLLKTYVAGNTDYTVQAGNTDDTLLVSIWQLDTPDQVQHSIWQRQYRDEEFIEVR